MTLSPKIALLPLKRWVQRVLLFHCNRIGNSVADYLHLIPETAGIRLSRTKYCNIYRGRRCKTVIKGCLGMAGELYDGVGNQQVPDSRGAAGISEGR
jgi:hypothetical protein